MQLLWAKLKKAEPAVFHPLLCHSLDVAAVVRALWDVAMPRASRAFVRRHLGLSEDEHALAWLSFWAALHDLGKCSPTFQRMSPYHQQRLAKAGFIFSPPAPRPIHHSVITRLELPTAIKEALPETLHLPGNVTNALACCLGGHHGQFHTIPNPRPVSQIGQSLWAQGRRNLVAQLAAQLRLAEAPAPFGLHPEDHAFLGMLAGLISVADWIGSDECFFPFTPDMRDEAAYATEAQARARGALAALGWSEWQLPTIPMQFELLIGDKPPRPMQATLARLADSLRTPGLVLIEAPTGEGKTEAAIYLADHWNQLLGQRGIYVAMPTQATANAMHQRIRDDYLLRRYPERPPDLRLLHGQALLAAQHEQPLSAGQLYGEDEIPPAEDGALVAGDWFGYRKRGLLGPMAVGTVDQALMSVLQTRHGFVRLFGLAGKTVILDEVHAFDTYTSNLIDRTLAWLAALDCSVVLLSATLPADRRAQLIAAYGGDMTAATGATYPRITMVCHGQTEVHHCAATAQSEIAVRWVEEPAQDVLMKLEPLVADGGCVGWVCNTVACAQDTYRALTAAFAGRDVEVRLFHARYPMQERARREAEALRLFGKHKAQRPRAAVLVATQVIEQSLDLDFDLLISEVAPADLVLQRAGRLHRHQGTPRPAWLAERTLWLLAPQRDAKGVPKFGASEYVYGEHLLLRTWLTLAQRERLLVPDDVEALIETVYGGSELAASPELAARLQQAQAEGEQTRVTLQDEALQRLIPPPSFDDTFTQFISRSQDLTDDENPQLHHAFRALTRFSDQPSYTIVCLRRRDGRTGVDTDRSFIEIALDQPPNERQLHALLDQTVSLSVRRATRYLETQQAASGWRQSALLRHCRAITFDEEGNAVSNDCPLRLDPELGIVVVEPGEEGP